MKIESVYDASFKPYGQILNGYDTQPLTASMETIPLPAEGVAYEPSIASLEANTIFGQLQNNAYGGMPVQIGMCWGHNTKLNCLEYHRDSEVNIGTGDFILLLAKQDEIVDGKLDTAKVRAFRVPAGVAVEVYATTLHYAPCHVNADQGVRVAVVLPKGTNEAKPSITPVNEEDKLLWAKNKWLLAHADSVEANQGAAVLLDGENIDIAAETLKAGHDRM
ncbi:MAG: DUF4867 family protein [Oscillospiraceae bacterium]|nr:DUF4867 family protein [Oscillospiraceae bacterium]